MDSLECYFEINNLAFSKINSKLLAPRRLIEFTFNAHKQVFGVIISMQKEVQKLVVLTADLESLWESKYGVAYENEESKETSWYIDLPFRNISKVFDAELKTEFSFQSGDRLR